MIRDKVFISYSHSNRNWLDLLLGHLKPFNMEGLVWNDQAIRPGEQWLDEIEKSLNSVKVAVLLLSREFMASEFIQEKELPRFLGPAENGEVIILPVLISACNWEHTSIYKFQSPHNPKKPLNRLSKEQRETVLADIAKAIHSAWKHSPTRPILTNCMQDIDENHGKILRARLRTLADQYSDLEPERLKAAIAKAMKQAKPDPLLVNEFPSIFNSGPIEDWPDLLRRTTPDPFPLDKPFLDAFEEALSLPPDRQGSLNSTGLSSLIVMVLEPASLSQDTTCPRYAFRAFFCPHEEATPDQWLIVDDRNPGYPIPADDFVEGLQPLFREALGRALAHVPSAKEPLLIELFLPRAFLNLDIGRKIMLTVPGENHGKSLASLHPIVLRSSDRYQYFHERRATTFQTTLPAKWDRARNQFLLEQEPCHWWQDPPPTPKKRSASLLANQDVEPPEDVMKRKFDQLRLSEEFFSFRRVVDLPTCPKQLETWLHQVINACPAVAIWWRPGASSPQSVREKSLRYRRQNSHSCFGVDQPPKKKLAHRDPFKHPHVTSPLRLFHSFAQAIFHGRLSDEHSLALSEVVLLMDCVERWPPRRDSELPFERRSDEKGEYFDVSAEYALYSEP